MLLASLSPIVLGVAGIIRDPEVFGTATEHSLWLVLIGIVLVLLVWGANPSPVRRPIQVRADATGLWLGPRFISRRKLRAGYVSPDAPYNDPRLFLRPRLGFPIVLSAANRTDCEALLHALRLDAASSTVSVCVLSPLTILARYAYWTSVGFLIPGIVLFVVWAMSRPGPGSRVDPLHPFNTGVIICILTLALIVFTVLTAFLLQLLARVFRQHLTIGVDGLEVSFAGWRTFFAYGDIAEIRTAVRGWLLGIERFGIVIRSGERGRTTFLPLFFGRTMRAIDGLMVVDRIQEAIDAFQATEDVDAAHILRRGDRSFRDWVVSLRRLGAIENASLRSQAVSREHLLRIARSPSQEPSARIAAAAALRENLSEIERAELWGAADGVALPKLRIALQRVADEAGDEEVELLLSELARNAGDQP